MNRGYRRIHSIRAGICAQPATRQEQRRGATPDAQRPTPPRLRRGTTLMETLIASLLSVVVGGTLVVLVQSTLISRTAIAGENTAYAGARKCMDAILDNVRSAQPYQIQASPAVYSAIKAASASSITCYTSNTGDTVKFWLDTTTSPATLKQTRFTSIGSGASTTTPILTGVQSLQFTYYTVSGGAYTSAASSWTKTANPNAPTDGERPIIGAVGVTITVTINGFTRQLSSFVRMRNSPYSG